MERMRLEISLEATQSHTPMLRKSLLGQVAQGCSSNKLIFHPFPQNTTHLHFTKVLKQALMVRTVDLLQCEVYWNKLFINIFRNLLADANSCSCPRE